MGKFRDKINTVFNLKKTHSDISGISLAGPYQPSESSDTEDSPSYQSYHKRVYDKAHHHLAEKPHAYLQDKSKTYDKWHSWEFKKLNHSHVHGAVAVAWVLLVGFLVASSIPSVSALSTWTQTDWSGGVGTSTSNQYSAASNIDASNSGQLTLSEGSNQFTNNNFDTNLDGWYGYNASHNAGSGYLSSGSAEVSSPNGSNIFPATVSGDITSPYFLAVADYDNDGYQDVASITSNSIHSVSVALSDGSGGYETPVDYELNTGLNGAPAGIVTEDLNKDGWPDIIAQMDRASTCVLLNNGDGTFASRAEYAGTYPQGISSGDYNDDDKIDIITSTGYSSGRIQVRYGDDSGILTNPDNYTVGASAGYYLESSDLNNDGKDDIVAGKSTTVGVMLSNGASFETINDYTTQTVSGIALGDLNNDNYKDIVIIGSSATQLMLNNGDGTFGSATNIAALDGISSNQVEIMDIDGDGWNDIAIRTSTGFNYVLNDQLGAFDTLTAVTVSSPYSLMQADINNDFKIDIIVGSVTQNKLTAYYNQSNGTALVQNFDVQTAGNYQLEGYVYTDGSEVTSSDVQMFANGEELSTTFSATATSGWYKIVAPVDYITGKGGYGVQLKRGNTAYIDDMKLYKYEDSGTLTSAIYDLTFGGDWDTLTFTTDNVSNTSVKIRTSNDSGMSGAPAFAGCPAITSGTDLTGQTCVTDNERYVQYEVALANDAGSTPVFSDITLQYGAYDTVPPTTNASSISMKRAAGGDTIASNGWSNGANPYFEWAAGADNGGGSGIKGYCLYLGQDNTGDPVSTKGNLGTSPLDTGGACQFAVSGTNVDTATANYIGTALTSSNSPYYLNVKAIDNANNVFASSVAQFQFRFDNTAPTNPSFVTAPSQFVASKEVTLTWPTSGGDAASDANSGLAGLQYRIGSTTWYGDSHSGTEDSTDLMTNDGTYTTSEPPDYDNINEGNNIVYFRTWDTAGNVSAVYTTTVIKLNTSSPSSPQNVTATPTTNTTNSFAFAWAAPSSYQGSASNITYCYTINTLPTDNTCTYTAAGVTSLDAGAFANQPGDNTFYVVARDEASNINYATAASTTFTANTSAPGIPLDLDVADVSTKATSTWRLALSWNAPTNVGAGVNSYRIYRSTDNVNFSQVASTSGTSYVDAGLSQQTYYYKLKACDSANNCGADSSVVNDLPTGRFTSPANITAEPSVSGVSTKRALIKWSTDRNSDSTVSIGTSAGNYQPFQIASNTQTTDHQIELNNLTPGTTYYAKASWTDEDGNTGSSSEFVFKTEPAPSTQEVEIRRTTLSSAQIRFTSVSAAKVVIQYGLSDSFGGVKEISTSLEKSTYDVELVGLNDGAKYFFRLNTFDADGNEYVGSTVLTFTTPARPAISNLRFQPVENEPTSTQQVTWTTNVPTSSLVRYTAANVPGEEVSVSDLVTEHEIIIRGLLDDTEYNFIAESRDKDGNLAVSDTQVLRTALDTRPPKITDVTTETTIRGSGAEARGQIIVSWKTDEPATSQVAYAEGSSPSDFNNRTSEDTALAIEHIVIVSDLPTSTVYSVRPVSKDSAANESEGEPQSAIIGRASDDVITIVLNTLKRVFGF